MCARSTGLHMRSCPNRDQRDIRAVVWVCFPSLEEVYIYRHLLALVRAPGGSCEVEGVCEGQFSQTYACLRCRATDLLYHTCRAGGASKTSLLAKQTDAHTSPTPSHPSLRSPTAVVFPPYWCICLQWTQQIHIL